MIETIFGATEYSALAGRALAGIVLALAVAGTAWRAGALSRTGFAAATVCGALCVAAGWNWAILLIVYFVAGAALSRAGQVRKRDLTEGIVSKGGPRDAVQVLANGGAYSAAALAAAMLGSEWLAWGAVGALAASSADTWATEIGVGLGRIPRSIINGTYVRPGESGGVTLVGLIGAAAGAAWIGLVSIVSGFSTALGIAAVIAGFGGSLADSILGATVQERRWCDACNEPTERRVHLCGTPARRAGGITGLNNDVVNLLATFAGLILGVMAYCIAGKLGVLRSSIG
jgi:uncharacterized protein (TIGR00297 family)